MAGHAKPAGGGLHSADPRGEIQRVLLGGQAHARSLHAGSGKVGAVEQNRCNLYTKTLGRLSSKLDGTNSLV